MRAASSLPRNPRRAFRWAGDAEGGAPYVEADPADPSRVVGFDVDVAELIARGLGREPQFVEVAFASIDQSIARGDAEIGLSGIEDTPARRAAYAVTIPYYQFREVLSVRSSDAGQFRTLSDLRGRRVGTLGGTIAYEILLQAEREHGIVAVSYEDDVHPYSDLLIGRLDAVLLDNVLAERRSRTTPGFRHASRTDCRFALRRRAGARRMPSCVTASMAFSSRRCVMGGWRRFSGSGRSGTPISRSCSREFSRVQPLLQSRGTRATRPRALRACRSGKRRVGTCRRFFERRRSL